MNFALEFSLQTGYSLVIPDTSYTEALFESVQKNREFVEPFVSWIKAITSKKETHYFLERNLRCYRELIGGQLHASNHSGFSCFIHHNQKCIGMTGYQGVSLKNKICALGYWIDEDFQGKGLILQANQILVNYAFDVLDMNRIEIQCATDNSASIKVAERLGFTKEARLREVEQRGSEFIDHFLFSKLRSEYNSGKK